MMHQEVSTPTFSENRGLFQIYLMGRCEAQQGRPLRTGHDLGTASQYWYQKGYEAGLASKEE